VPVIFRVWSKKDGGDVTALFPTIPYDREGHECQSYQHVGQHGGADCAGVINRTRAAKPEEYASLKRELEGEPFNYKLKVVERMSRSMIDQRKREASRPVAARDNGDGGSYGPGKFSTMLDSYAYGLSMDGVDEEAGSTDTGGWYGLIWLDEAGKKAIAKLASDDEKPLTSEEADLLKSAQAVVFYERTDGIVETEWYERQSEAQENWDRIVREVEGGNGNGNGDDDFDLQSELETAMVIGDSRSGYSVSLEDKHLEDFKDYDEALKFAVQKMEDDSYWPNLFHVNERGNTDLLSYKVKKNKKGKVTKVETEIVRSWT
jgi:hypothetical protein